MAVAAAPDSNFALPAKPSSQLAHDAEGEVELAETQCVSQEPAWPSGGSQCVHARLVATAGASVGNHEMREEELLIGRHAACQVVLEDGRISARHLRIYRSSGGKPCYVVEQLGSNGSYVNGHHMKKGDTRLLQHGDEVSLCMHARDTRQKPIASFLFLIAGNPEEEGLKPKPAVALPIGAVARPRAPPAPRQQDLGGEGSPGSSSSRHVTDHWVHDRWDLGASLGSGFFSKVRVGLQVESGARRAVKIVDRSKFLAFQTRNGSHLTLSSEAEVLTSLDHPGIVRFHEWFQTDAHFFLVMELVEGGDLLDYIMCNGCYSEPVALRLFRELISAMEYLHSRNIVHRDLKPDNILLTERSENAHLKIADFGLARTNTRSCDCRTFCGTPQYFAPELVNTLRGQAEGQPSGGYGKQVDMWSLGVILYIMLSGVPPFDEEAGQLYQLILEGRYEFDVPQFNVVSHEAKDMVRRLMTVDPKERITVMQAARHAWLQQGAGSYADLGCKDVRIVDGTERAPKRRRTVDEGASSEKGLEMDSPAPNGALAACPSFDF